MATRTTIRQWAGDLSRQMLVLTATGAGTTTTFVDAINLADADSSLIGRVGWTSGGTAANLGRELRVSDNDRSDTSITFTPALPSATASSDEIELWNDLDQGVTPAEVNRLINRAIETVADANPVPDTAAEVAFDYADPVITLETDWRWFEGADYEDSNGIWHQIPATFEIFRVDEAARTVEILPPWSRKIDDLNIRLRGSTRPSALTTDTGTTGTTVVDAEYLAHWVAAEILLAAAYTSMDGAALERRAAKRFTEAETLRAKARTRHTGLGILLPVAA